jgi:hypothetical protein
MVIHHITVPLDAPVVRRNCGERRLPLRTITPERRTQIGHPT